MKTLNKILFVLLLLTTFSSAYAQKYWGAIYLDKNTGIAGGSSDAGSDSNARNTALKSCQLKHKGKKNNCSYVISFSNNCAAVSWSPNGASGYAYQPSLSDAKEFARVHCMKAGGGERKDCRVVLDFCTTRFY